MIDDQIKRVPRQTLTSKLTFIFCLVIWLLALSKDYSIVRSSVGLFRIGSDSANFSLLLLEGFASQDD